ncbi:MAG: uroporphyrinogen-III synthase [Mariprofundaceae bacterium]|nr:uroporphyrinogen-III synthase [Mariprofundaceae bacterium]
MSGLAGKQILVTRAAEQYERVASLIEQRGAHALSLPCLAVQCMPDHIRTAMNQLRSDSSILLSSANGVDCAAQALGDDFIPVFSRHPVIVVGSHTAQALATYDIQAAWTADEASQDGLIRDFAGRDMPARICFLRAEQGSDVLQEFLQAQGVAVELVHAYRTICPDDDNPEITHALQLGVIDAVLLGSSRTAQHYVQRIGDATLADKPAVAVISRQVADAAQYAGLSVQAVAKEASFVAMLNALEEFFTAEPKTSAAIAATRSTMEETHR